MSDEDVLKNAAEKVAEHLPEEQRESFKADYVDIISRLNKTIDYKIEELEMAMLEVLGSSGHSPSAIQTYASTQVVAVKKAVMTYLATLDTTVDIVAPIFHNSFIEMVDACYAAVEDMKIKNQARAGKKVD